MTTSATSVLGFSAEAAALSAEYRLGTHPIYVIGSFDTGVTILNQQVRALNLAYALVRNGDVPSRHDDPPIRVAVVGAGFAGLTFAAGLIAKRARAAVTLFERRDIAIPFQQGSDTRWVHPHIYDWPRRGSESVSAGLPLLNWTASRASDVVVQVLNDWKLHVRQVQADPAATGTTVRFFCNTGHLQIAPADTVGQVAIEWSGDSREPSDPAVPTDRPDNGGKLESFDMVVLAAGFGVEEGEPSYWRNEQFAQPHLGQATKSYIVSGAGDGAMIDLFRLRIAQFRQDRILPELFHDQDHLVRKLRDVQAVCDGDNPPRVFDQFERLWLEDSAVAAQALHVTDRLRKRLRRDTTVILHVRKARFSDLFDGRRVSFQNRILAYVLFKAGGFTQSRQNIKALADEFAVPENQIVRRHGVKAAPNLNVILSKRLRRELKSALADHDVKLRQPGDIRWTGGYFGFPGRDEADLSREGDPDADRIKAHWRKEYLPGLTQSVAASFCSAVAAHLAHAHAPGMRLRVTLHRKLLLGTETLLQQCCAYDGLNVGAADLTAGRTFHAADGTIGAAYVHQALVRSAPGATSQQIQDAMDKLALNRTSRTMSKKVRSIAAVPLIGIPAEADGSVPQETVVGLLYLDSEEANYFNDDESMRTVIAMTEKFLHAAGAMPGTLDGRVVNNEFWTGRSVPATGHPSADARTIRCLEVGALPITPVRGVGQLNLDQSDFAKAVPT